MSLKRRRGIGLRKWLVSALKDYAQREGVSSHTTAVNQILRGKLAPLREYERYKVGGDLSKQGVSMPEELWLALKEYTNRRRKSESDTRVACRILVGKIPPIPESCIEEGRRLARSREAERGQEIEDVESESAPAPNPDPAPEQIAQSDSSPIVESQEEIIREEREEESKRMDERGRPLSDGVPVSGRSLEKKINPDDDSYGGVFNL